MAHVIVTKNYQIDITGDGGEAGFIKLADSLYAGGLDSLDAGDAVGAMIQFAEQDGNTDDLGSCYVQGFGVKVHVSWDMELFNWTEQF